MAVPHVSDGTALGQFSALSGFGTWVAQGPAAARRGLNAGAPSSVCFVRIPKPADTNCEPEPLGINQAGTVFGNLWGKGCPELPFGWERGDSDDGTTRQLEPLKIGGGRPAHA